MTEESTANKTGGGALITLESLRPKLPTRRRLLRVVLFLVCIGVLVVSYRTTAISPGTLWSNRGKAVEFLFGRGVSEQDRADAKAQAERFPDMLATQQARDELRTEYASRNEPLPREPGLGRQVRARADKILASQPAGEREAIIEREYTNAVSKLKGGFFPPETDHERVTVYLGALIETVAIALWGTLLAVAGAIPLALAASRTTVEILVPGETPLRRGIRRFCRFGVRRFLDLCRGLNEFVLALIIVAIIGLGPFTGVLALFIHSTGVLGKVLSEALDSVDKGPIEGVASTGSRPLQIISFAVVPQIMPLLVSNSLLRFETNVRSASILGVVGAGGIGFLMSDKINGYQYREVCTMLVVVLAAVTLIDLACTRLMRAAA